MNILRAFSIFFGVACLLLLLYGQNAAFPLATDLQMLLLTGGVGLLAWGAWPTVRTRTRPRRTMPLLVGIILLGVALRLANLEDAVHHFVDEAHFAAGVADLRDDDMLPVLRAMANIAAFPRTYAYLQHNAADLLGANLTALRIVSVVFGTLTIPAVYLTGRWLFDQRVGLLAALLLATFPPHIHLSRMALNNIADPLFGTLMIALLARRRYALAGVMLGLTQYWYEGGKLLYPALAGLWFLGAAFRYFNQVGTGRPRRASAVRPAQIGAVALMALAVALPLVALSLTEDWTYIPRLQAEGTGGGALFAADGAAQLTLYLEEQLAPALLHFVTHPDGSKIYYGGETALVLPWLLPLLVVGLVVLLRRGRLLLPAWLLLTALGNSLIDDPDYSARFAVAFPALVMIVAVGALWVWDRITLRLTPTWRVALIVAFAVMIVAQPVYYFGPHLTTYNRQIRPFRDHQDVIWRLRDLPPGTQGFLFTDELTYVPHIEMLSRYWDVTLDLKFLHPLELRLRSTAALPPGAGLAFFVEPDDRETLRFLARTFTLTPPEPSPYNLPADKQYWLIRPVE